MKTPTKVVMATALVALFGAASSAQRAAQGPAQTKILLSIEPVLVDSTGLHPLSGTTDFSRVELGSGGAFYQTVELEPDRSDLLIYKLAYTPIAGARIRLSLERSRQRHGASEVLPAVEATISALETWSTSLFEDAARGRRVVLRVLPELRVPSDDEPLTADRFVMRFKGGPLVWYGRDRQADRIIFRAVNTGGPGVEFGIPGFGVVRLHLRPFPGASRVGWVRGTTMAFELKGESFQLWSETQILPEDPDRPGKGWVLYGAALPASEGRAQEGYYGPFLPGK